MDGVHFGDTSEVFVRQRQGSSLSDHVQLFIPSYFRGKVVEIKSKLSTEVGGLSAITVELNLDKAAENRTLVFVADPSGKLVFASLCRYDGLDTAHL